MLAVTLASLRTQARRFLAPGLAVLVGIGFVTATLSLSRAASDGVLAALSGDLGRYAAVVTPANRADTMPASTLETARSTPGVASVTGQRLAFGSWSGGGTSASGLLTSPPLSRTVRTAEGRLPSASGELAVSTGLAAALKVGVGDQVRWVAAPDTPLTVVGILDTGKDLATPPFPAGIARLEDVATLSGDSGLTALAVTAAPGSSDERVSAALRAALGASATVRTGPDEAIARASAFTGGLTALTSFVAAFGAISLFVAGLVVANTFAMLLARRTRETALLRCVGATRGQVARATLVEATIVGLVSAALGTVLGYAAALALSRIVDGLPGGIPLAPATLPPAVAVGAVLAGVLITTIAALAPVVRGSRVAPLVALRPDAVPAGSRPRRLRLVVATLALLGGAVLLTLGARKGHLALGIPGGALSFLGVLGLGPVLVPAATRLVGWPLSRFGGIPGRLAVVNAVRNPARAAGTAGALLVGVTLIAMMTVGAATTSRTMDATLDRLYLVDVSISATGPLSEQTVASLGRVPGVRAVSTHQRADVQLGSAAVTAVGVGEAARSVLHDPSTVPAAGTVLVGQELARAHGLTSGQRVVVTGPAGSREVAVQVGRSLEPALLAESDLRAVALPRSGADSVWLRLDSNDVPATLDRIRAAVASVPGVQVGGSASERATVTEIMDVLLAVVTGLLGVSVLIAVFGIASTLGLSVLERSRESALLRALGLTRPQLRGTLALEAGLLGVVGALLGSALGIAYGYAGARCLFGERITVALEVPWGRLALIGLVALLCGLVASVLPARRAARIAPAAALAVE